MSQPAEQILENAAPALIRKAIDMALTGDRTMMRLCLDHLATSRNQRLMSFALPEITSREDMLQVTRALLSAVAKGHLTPSEAASLGKLVDSHIRATDLTDIIDRVKEFEETFRRKPK